jgi:hypothetical protein
MEKKRKRTIYILLFILTTVASLTIAYAALSATLRITGEATVTESRWNFYLGNGISLSGREQETTGSATYQKPTFNGTTASYQITLAKPGDSVTYYFKIFNTGTINGEIATVTNATPKCTSTTGVTADESLVCDNLIYDISYNDGEKLSEGDVYTYHSEGNQPNVCLNGRTTGRSKSMKVTIKLNENLTTVPSSTVTVSNLSTSINLVQSDKICEPDGGAAEPVNQ